MIIIVNDDNDTDDENVGDINASRVNIVPLWPFHPIPILLTSTSISMMMNMMIGKNMIRMVMTIVRVFGEVSVFRIFC